MATPRIHRKGLTQPLKIREHDNDISAVKKLCRQETARRAGKLPPVTEDPFFYTKGEAETNAVGTRIPEAATLTYGTGVVLHFNEQTLTPIPFVNVDPRPQQEGHGLGISYVTPVYNAGMGQDRYVTPHTTTPDYTIDFVGTGANDLTVGTTELITAGSNYVVEIHTGDPRDPNTFDVTITVPPRPPLWVETIISITDINITAGWQEVDDTMGGSIWIMFDATTGHDAGDTFEFMIGGGEPVMMGGGGKTEATSTVFRVDSDDDYAELSTAERLFCFPTGKMSVWMQGFGDDAADGNRNYYIMDIGHEFILYYEYEAGVTSRLVWYPNVSSGYRLTLDVADGIVGVEERGYFGFIPRKLTLVWDFAAQIFEMYYDGYRAESVSVAYIPAPDVMSLPVSLGNSLRRDIYGDGGDENAFQYFDEWTFTKLAPGLMEVTAIDGNVMQTLIPVHNGVYDTACGTTMTPINLGDHLTPFDHIYGRYFHVECMITPSPYTVTHCIAYIDLYATAADHILLSRPWTDEPVLAAAFDGFLRWPRDLTATVVANAGLNPTTGTITLNGFDTDGGALAVVINVNVAGGGTTTYTTNEAFMILTEVVVDQTDAEAGATYTIGIGDKYGIPNYPLNAAGDVLVVIPSLGPPIGPAAYTVNATYGTVDVLAGILLGEDYHTIYRPFA